MGKNDQNQFFVPRYTDTPYAMETISDDGDDFFGLTKLACVPKKQRTKCLDKKNNRPYRPKTSPSLRVLGPVISFGNISNRYTAISWGSAPLSRYTDTPDGMKTISDDGDDFLA